MSAWLRPPPHDGCHEPPFIDSVAPADVLPLTQGRWSSSMTHEGGGGCGMSTHAVSGPPTSPDESQTVLSEQTRPASWSAAVTMCEVPWDPSDGQYTSTATSGGEHGFH